MDSPIINQHDIELFPKEWGKLPSHLGIAHASEEVQLATWKQLVEQYVTERPLENATYPAEIGPLEQMDNTYATGRQPIIKAAQSELDQYKTLFQQFYISFWLNRENLKKQNRLLTQAAFYGYDIWIRDNIDSLDVNDRNNDRDTALHMAAHRNHEDIAVLLLSKGADPRLTDARGDTPLHIAAASNSIGVADAILDADETCISIRGRESRLPFTCATLNGNLSTMSVLVERNADAIKKDPNTLQEAMKFAITNNRPNMVRFLHSIGVDINKTVLNEPPLTIAANPPRGKFPVEAAAVLVELGVAVKADHQTPLYLVAYNTAEKSERAVEFAQLLIKSGAEIDKPNSDGRTAMSYLEDNKAALKGAQKALYEYLRPLSKYNAKAKSKLVKQ
jgi:ankyrin repeat protein